MNLERKRITRLIKDKLITETGEIKQNSFELIVQMGIRTWRFHLVKQKIDKPPKVVEWLALLLCIREFSGFKSRPRDRPP